MIGQESPFALSPDQKTVALVRRLHAEQASRPSVYPAGTRVSASDSVTRLTCFAPVNKIAAERNFGCHIRGLPPDDDFSGVLVGR